MKTSEWWIIQFISVGKATLFSESCWYNGLGRRLQVIGDKKVVVTMLHEQILTDWLAIISMIVWLTSHGTDNLR